MQAVASGSARILVVEDDQAVREGVVAGLRDEGYEVRELADGMRVEEVTRDFRPDLALLDVRLPVGPGGLSMARVIRGVAADIPIIFLTAADATEDRLAGFDAGADDYIAKPFAMAELKARIRALLKRSGKLTSDAWSADDLVVDESARTATRGGVELDLTRTEFDLLNALGRNQGKVMSKTQLLTTVWGFDAYDPNLVEVHMSSLRRKLEGQGARLIQTVRGVGYVLRP